MKTSVDDFIIENWGILTLKDFQTELSISLTDLLETAFKLKLHLITTPNMGRTWTKEEDNFMKNFSGKMNIQEASNILYRSRYATYQRVKFLSLNEMIGK